MKRRPRLPARGKAPALVVEKDAATGAVARTARRPAKRYSRLALPHERDEGPHRPGPPTAITEQAARDLDEGQVDTDRYTETGKRFDRRHGKV
jgi:hypothetical protein